MQAYSVRLQPAQNVGFQLEAEVLPLDVGGMLQLHDEVNNRRLRGTCTAHAHSLVVRGDSCLLATGAIRPREIPAWITRRHSSDVPFLPRPARRWKRQVPGN